MASLYLHIPFCEHKCVYCSFYSIESLEGTSRFIDAVGREIHARADALALTGDAPSEYHTVFLGGGTPSLLSPDQLSLILTPLRERFLVRDDAEFTIECNPGTLTPAWLEGYRELGINRMSFGVQSFHDDELAFLTRIHTAEVARRSIAEARRVFDNVSLDLIFALPGQTIERWRANLREAVELGTTHVSAYSLIFEEGTPLNAQRLRGAVRPAPDELEAEMYEETVRVLGGGGFRQYEVSNYALPGRECRHNVAYWERDTYVSFGPSAHSLLRRSSGDERWANVSSLTGWHAAIDASRLPEASRETLDRTTAFEEVVMLGLRSRGIDLAEVRRLIGDDLLTAAPRTVAAIVDGEYGNIADGRLALTAAGMILADRFALELITEAERLTPAGGRP